MIFDTVSRTEMQAAHLLTGATIVAFLAAPLFRGRAQKVRLATVVIYIVGVLAFIAYNIW
jgi:hypothetical protein